MIKPFNILLLCLVYTCLSSSCRAPKKLSKKYYFSHRENLKQINASYDEICNRQPFILNFTDTRFKHYSLEINTDSMRYVYNTSIMKFSVADSITRFGLDTNQVKKLGQQMFASKCICVARHSFYLNDQEFSANWLFFRQVQTSMFKESRYHVLIFFKGLLSAEVNKEFIERRKLIQLENNVFYTISDRFK